MKYLREQIISEDMLAPVGSLPAAGSPPSSPGLTHQLPSSLPGAGDDIMTSVGPGKEKRKKTKGVNSSIKPNKDDNKSYVVNKVLSFGDFISSNA